MSKESLKCILSMIYFICGIFLTILFSIQFDATSPASIITILLGLLLTIVGLFAFILHYKNSIIINQLKQNKLPILAKWTYNPSDFKLVKDKILEDCYVDLSLVILIGIFSLVLAAGLLFSFNPHRFSLSALLIVISILSSSLFSLFIHFYYTNKLTKCSTAIISNRYIYFNNELYSIYKSCYILEDIEILSEPQCYLKFIYGAPGTPYGPYEIINIPVPSSELALANEIKQHYLSLIT